MGPQNVQTQAHSWLAGSCFCADAFESVVAHLLPMIAVAAESNNIKLLIKF